MWYQRWSSKDDLVNHLTTELALNHDVIRALHSVDRGIFCPEDADDGMAAHVDAPMSIGCGQTISAPHMHAMALDLLSSKLRPGSRFLDVGSGSGIMCAYAAVMMDVKANERSQIVGVEVIESLCNLGQRNLDRWDPELRNSGRVLVRTGDGYQGYDELKPYDAIHVGAAASTLPLRLVAQLAEGGLMMLPFELENRSQLLVRLQRGQRSANTSVAETSVSSDIPVSDAAVTGMFSKTLTRSLKNTGGGYEETLSKETSTIDLPYVGPVQYKIICGVQFVPLIVSSK